MIDSPARLDRGLPVVPARGTLRPLGIDQVRITGGFWGDMQRLNAANIIEHCEYWVEKIGWIGNFDAAVEGTLPSMRRGRSFSDSDVYKLIEAMAWEIGRSGDQAMDARLRSLVARIAPAQEVDGYLNTNFGRPGQAPRYSDLEWGHELYSYGHLLQAAIARGRTHGDDLLVEVAHRVADHICTVFGPGGIERVCGHPEIEVALAEFSRFTGDHRYLRQAALFIERRGHGTLGAIEFGQGYFQDDVPVRDMSVLGGHAVRALYLAAGGVDVAVDSDDDQLLSALVTQMANTVAHRTYITGGMGSHHEGESFGLDDELPPDRAYSETCAGVASIMTEYRLLLATGESHYADHIERTLYNVIATSPSEDGRAFFYTNTLHQRAPGIVPPADKPSPRASSSLRAPWFEVSCCPTNVARTIASLGAYLATVDDSGLQLHQYADADIRTTLANGTTVAVRVSTAYPAKGRIEVEIIESGDCEWKLSLRVPAWAQGAILTVGGSASEVAPGIASVTRKFLAGEVLWLDLPVVPRWRWPNERVDAIRGTVALEVGPVVYCVESVDLINGRDVNGLRVHPDEAPQFAEGVVTVATSDLVAPGAPTVATPLIPYHRWANRGLSTMRVWMPLASN